MRTTRTKNTLVPLSALALIAAVSMTIAACGGSGQSETQARKQDQSEPSSTAERQTRSPEEQASTDTDAIETTAEGSVAPEGTADDPGTVAAETN